MEIHNWIVIAPDNTVTIRIAQMEMGQGGMSTMAQFLAEELEVDWSKIRTEFISIATHLHRHKVYGRTETTASSGVRLSELRLRTAGAQIRTMLLRAASEHLRAPESEFVADNSVITHTLTGTKLTYGELAAAAAKVAVPDPASIKLKDPRDWKYIGKSYKRVDIPTKVDGTAVFGIDVRVPGMKHAAIMISPVFGGTLKSYDALKIGGGKAGFVEGMDDAIAVVADDWWQAKTAIDTMPKDWDGGPWATVNSDGILQNLRAGLEQTAQTVLRKEGDVEAALSSTAMQLEAEYFVPYLEQATMEPMNCTALVHDHGFEVWAPTQVPESAMMVAAKVTGFPSSRGELHVTHLGGGFGRRLYSDFVSHAVQIAKQMKGTPVKLVWTREETMRHSFYRPASLSSIRGGIDANGKLSAWAHRIVAQSENNVLSTFGADKLLLFHSQRVGRSRRQAITCTRGLDAGRGLHHELFRDSKFRR